MAMQTSNIRRITLVLGTSAAVALGVSLPAASLAGSPVAGTVQCAPPRCIGDPAPRHGAAVALNPQPIPPGRHDSRVDGAVALNPQPIPPGRHDSRVDGVHPGVVAV
jgi:hypothetical protein